MSNDSPKLIVLLFTDLVDSTRLKLELGDADYVAHIARPHNEILRTVFAEQHGRENNYTGDGFLATFDSVADAVNAALLIHERLKRHPWQRSVPLTRIGVHLGDTALLAGKDDSQQLIASYAADVCARVMSLGAGGQTLLTRAAFDSARQYIREHPAAGTAAEPLELVWLAHGLYVFKGRDEPMEIFEVGAKDLAPLTAPADGEKAKRAVTVEQQATLGWRPAPELAIPRRLDWIIQQKIGEGGFGEVWLARHRRTKAERVFKFCFDAERVRHFKRELTLFKLLREVLGERRDIARLLEVELESPPYFLESEYVREGNLREWADRAGGIDAIPVADRLAMLAQIARAVAAAHSIGVIHKDLKPSNILIGRDEAGAPQPMLADFGVGAVADRSLLAAHDITMTGLTQGILDDSSDSGTRLYQPPETMVGQPPTIQGDVYALGVMLYQLCIGDLHRPLGIGWEADLADDEILRDDVRDATHRDPSKRLSSAAELAERIETLDARRLARLASVKAQRRARRARALAWVAAASLLISAFTGGLLAFSYRQWTSAQRSAELAELRRQDADAAQRAERQQREEAEAQRAVAERQRDRSEAMAKTLISSLEQLNPLTRGGSPGQLLDNIASEVAQRYDDNPLLLAEMLMSLGYAYRGNGLYGQSADMCRRAREIREEHLGPEDPLTLDSINALGIALTSGGQPRDAIPLHKLAYERRKQALGPFDAETLDSLHCLAFDHTEAGELEAALPLQQQVLKDMREHLGDQHSYTLTALNNLGYLYEKLDRVPEALELFEAKLELCRQNFPNLHQDTLMALNNVAWCNYRLERYDDAIPLARQAYEGNLQLFGKYHPDTTNSLMNLLRDYRLAGRMEEAAAACDRYAGSGEERTQALNYLSTHYRLRMAEIYFAVDRDADAAPFWESAAADAKQLLSDVANATFYDLYYAGSGCAIVAAAVAERKSPEEALDYAALAMDCLRAAYAKPNADRAMFRTDPDLKPLSDKPEFKALLESAPTPQDNPDR